VFLKSTSFAFTAWFECFSVFRACVGVMGQLEWVCTPQFIVCLWLLQDEAEG